MQHPVNRLSKQKIPSKDSGSHVLGIGLDNKDSHKRITRAEEFSIVGGSQDTHDGMTETLIKTVEDLERKGKRLSSAEPEEVSDLLLKNMP